MPRTKVVIVGAAGETGTSITNGLLERATEFDITALARPSSVDKPENKLLADRGVKVMPAELLGSQEKLVKLLTGVDVVIAALGWMNQLDQIPLVTAAKAAGVRRFVPCGFITVAPPKGVMWLREQKEEVYNHIRKLYLPYTFIDVGFWYQFATPKLASGRIDYAIMNPGANVFVGDGNAPSAITDLRDIGRYVARIILDPRTLNKMVFAYNELLTQEQIFHLLEKLSGESVEKQRASATQIHAQVKAAREAIENEPLQLSNVMQVSAAEYFLSWGLRGDNTPEYAKYLGYLTSKELYPDFEQIKYVDYLNEVLGGKAKPIYANLKLG